MSIRLVKADFLRQLETVEAGISNKGIIEQSSCFVFRDGNIYTFNGELFFRMKTNLPTDFEGAIKAEKFIKLIRKIPDDELIIENRQNELYYSGKNKDGGVTMENKVNLPIDEMETPTEWKKLPEDFSEGLSLVLPCAGSDQNKYIATCIHFKPNYMEATDNFHMSRFLTNTGVEKSTLVRQESIQHILPLDMVEMSATNKWLHFRNPLGLVVSCRILLGEYPTDKLSKVFEVRGTPTTLPKGLITACECAEIFTEEDKDHNQVIVKLSRGKVTLKGEGSSGWHREVKGLDYDGDPIAFMIPPKLLGSITDKHSDCEVTPNFLRVQIGSKYTYISSLELENQPGE